MKNVNYNKETVGGIPIIKNDSTKDWIYPVGVCYMYPDNQTMQPIEEFRLFPFEWIEFLTTLESKGVGPSRTRWLFDYDDYDLTKLNEMAQSGNLTFGLSGRGLSNVTSENIEVETYNGHQYFILF